jgi:aminodeoxyfutalosine deaminase
MPIQPSIHYALLQSMPKAELHVHLEGAIQPATLLELATRHNRWEKLPGRNEAALREWFRFTDFPHFIQIYTAISDLLRTPDDFALITVAFAGEMARQHIRYAEVTFSPYTHIHLLDKGLTIQDLFAGLDQGRAIARQQYDVEIAWVFDIVRGFSFRSLNNGIYDMRPAEITLEYALAGRNHGVIGFGLGGNEVGAPPSPFAHAFDQARNAGLISVPHAGEMAGPDSVWGAIHALGAQRIGHGVRSIEDPLLLAYLRQSQIPLEINITSNICLHAYKRVAHHPFPHLDRMGILVTVNSDDPPLFNTDLTHEYTILVDEFGYSLADVARIARNAFVAAVMPEPLRINLLAEFDTWVKANIAMGDVTAAPHATAPQ